MSAPSTTQKSERPPGREIENDPGANPCFGCGPDNPDGLHLHFYDDGEVVRAPFVLDERFQSWPGFANMGIVFTALQEAGAWAIWERLGPSRIDGPTTVTQSKPAMVGPLMAEVRVELDGDKARIDAVATQGGHETLRASWSARRAKPEESNQLLAAFPDIPRSLKPGFEDRAAERPTGQGPPS
ncbi:MAG TPA: hypothetical protein VM370_09600 [Candidatus Thermoplasmatota archaeon]|nr:hypothetical protein [Candidatus Thermoplasmatota archaeon]